MATKGRDAPKLASGKPDVEPRIKPDESEDEEDDEEEEEQQQQEVLLGEGEEDDVYQWWAEEEALDSSSSDDEDDYGGGSGGTWGKAPRPDRPRPGTFLGDLRAFILGPTYRLEDLREDLRSPFDFPDDPEWWEEVDLHEYWIDMPVGATRPGWDPAIASADPDEWRLALHQRECGGSPNFAPFYLPYRRAEPLIPDPEDDFDIVGPKGVIEELDRIEEFLKWVSCIFKDGSSYEGTVWDDKATGKGVYITRNGFLRYEGEWLQNAMDGHGVSEFEIPKRQPGPGSRLEARMRAAGKIINRDFMPPDDQKWLAMDVKAHAWIMAKHGVPVTPFYEKYTWLMLGNKPEKGRYKYAGQWKHGKMHGCGVHEVNERILYGRFYFGEYVGDSSGCDADTSALHAGIAEVAAAKARMFVNKPDGMVREKRGPYNDPQHPYFYEKEDTWMAPGFINQFYETPDYWKAYVEEVDKEREMWLNSFYKAPLRIPMPAELEYWWANDDGEEFLLVNKEPEPDPEDPSRLVYTEDPLIYHIRSERFIDYVEDEKYGIRLFWHPKGKGEDEAKPEAEAVADGDVKLQFLPLGFDEFYGLIKHDDNWLVGLGRLVENSVKHKLGLLEKWLDEKKKTSDLNMKLIEHQLDLVENEICLEEETKEFEAKLKRKQQEEEKRALMDLDESSISSQVDIEVDSDEEDEDEDEKIPSSFGKVTPTKDPQKGSKDDKKGSQPGSFPFSSLSLSFGTFASAIHVPKKILGSFLSRNHPVSQQPSATRPNSSYPNILKAGHNTESASSISYPRKFGQGASLRVAKNARRKRCAVQKNLEHVVSMGAFLKRCKASSFQNNSWHADHAFQTGLRNLERDLQYVLSWHVPIGPPEMCSIK